MSYGVLVSRTGHLMLEPTHGAGAGGRSEEHLERFRTLWGAAWVPGRVTLTRLHVSFVPHRVTSGVSILELSLSDVSEVQIGTGFLARTIGLCTPGHTTWLRCHAAAGLGEQIAALASDLRRHPRPPRLPRRGARVHGVP